MDLDRAAMNYLNDEPMKLHTTFRTGGPADRFCSVSSPDELKAVLAELAEKQETPVIIGNGSNLLVSDRGIKGTVVEIGEHFRKVTVDGQKIYAEAGAPLSVIAATARDASLGGFEFASGIPGTLGGAICMNAGAYDGEMKDVVEYVDVLRNGKTERVPGADMKFGYRHSICSEEPVIVLGACIVLQPKDREEIQAKMQELNRRRREKQPLEFPSAGSTFKRPVGHFAGKLIQDAGLAGYRVGGAEVSEKHCGFVINRGDATSGDIYQLIQHVIRTVEEQFGVTLEPEVRLLGDFTTE